MHTGASAASMTFGCVAKDAKTAVRAAMAVVWRCDMASTVYGGLYVQKLRARRRVCAHVCT